MSRTAVINDTPIPGGDDMTGMMTDPRADEELRAELDRVQQLHPGWHAFLSDERRSWAVRVHPGDGTGCGVTLDADHPSLLDCVITAWEHNGLRVPA